MFTGESRVRKVAVKSKTAVVAKDDVLTAARSERESRAVEKARHSAALKLQALYRSSRVRYNWKCVETATLHKRINDLLKVDQVLVRSGKGHVSIPIQAQLQLVRSSALTLSHNTPAIVDILTPLLTFMTATPVWLTLSGTNPEQFNFFTARIFLIAIRTIKHLCTGSPCWHIKKEGVASVEALLRELLLFFDNIVVPHPQLCARLLASDPVKDVILDAALNRMEEALREDGSKPLSSNPLYAMIAHFFETFARIDATSAHLAHVLVESRVLCVPYILQGELASVTTALTPDILASMFQKVQTHVDSHMAAAASAQPRTYPIPVPLLGFLLGNLCDAHSSAVRAHADVGAEYQEAYLSAVCTIIRYLPRGFLAFPKLPVDKLHRTTEKSGRTKAESDADDDLFGVDVDIEAEPDDMLNERTERHPMLAVRTIYGKLALAAMSAGGERSESPPLSASAGAGSKRSRDEHPRHRHTNDDHRARHHFLKKHELPLLRLPALHTQISGLQVADNVKALCVTASRKDPTPAPSSNSSSSSLTMHLFSLLYQSLDATYLIAAAEALGREASAVHSTTANSLASHSFAFLRSLHAVKIPEPFSLFVWHSIKHLPALKAFHVDAHEACTTQAEIAHTLLLLFSLLNYEQMVTDDVEFFEGAAFPLDEMRELLQFLKQLLFRLAVADKRVTEAPLTKRGLLPVALLDAGFQLFNALFDRQSRKQFVEPAAWLWPFVPDISADVLLGLEDTEAAGGIVVSSSALGTPSSAKSSLKQRRAEMILTMVPQVIPFDTRVALFTELREAEHEALRQSYWRSPPLTIRRNHLIRDSYDAFQRIKESKRSIKDHLQIEFINAEGLREAGIDGGGLLKEFIDSVVKAAFSPTFFLFRETVDHTVYPNPYSHMSSSEHLSYFEFLGELLGKALLEGILVEPRFATFFLRKLVGKSNMLDDLSSLDPVMYRSLMSLKRMTSGWADLGLTFEITEDVAGTLQQVPLLPHGADIAVDSSNVIEYLVRYADFKLNKQISDQCKAFLRGFRQLVPLTWIRMFGAHELQTLIGGSEATVDIDDLRRNTVYGTGYFDGHPVIESFWHAMREFSEEDKRNFLMFVTSCSRPPLLGFSALYPKFGISKVPISDDSERLPSAATCMSLLKLPTYSTPEVMKEKLLLAIRSGAGFELS